MRTMRRRASWNVIALAMALGLGAAAQPALEWRPVAAGVDHLHLTRAAPGGGQWNVHALQIDPSLARLDVIRAQDSAIGLERTSSIAARTKAIAAINGGYFRTSGTFLGDSTGVVTIDGEIWSEPDRGRAAVGLVRGPAADRLLYGHVRWDATIAAGGAQREIDGINRARGADELVIFTPHFGPKTITDDSGVEVAVAGGKVTDVRDGAGETPIPRDGVVISARGRAALWVRRNLAAGAAVDVAMALAPADASDATAWAAAEDVLGAGPKLVSGGRIDVTDEREKMVTSFAPTLHPRTAIGSRADGTVVLLVADGRHPPERVGLSLHDLARLIVELGVTEAINLDGGGSSTMVIGDRIVNAPSDPIGERAVSDAIVVRAR